MRERLDVEFQYSVVCIKKGARVAREEVLTNSVCAAVPVLDDEAVEPLVEPTEFARRNGLADYYVHSGRILRVAGSPVAALGSVAADLQALRDGRVTLFSDGDALSVRRRSGDYASLADLKAREVRSNTREAEEARAHRVAGEAAVWRGQVLLPAREPLLRVETIGPEFGVAVATETGGDTRAAFYRLDQAEQAAALHRHLRSTCGVREPFLHPLAEAFLPEKAGVVVRRPDALAFDARVEEAKRLLPEVMERLAPIMGKQDPGEEAVYLYGELASLGGILRDSGGAGVALTALSRMAAGIRVARERRAGHQADSSDWRTLTFRLGSEFAYDAAEDTPSVPAGVVVRASSKRGEAQCYRVHGGRLYREAEDHKAVGLPLLLDGIPHVPSDLPCWNVNVWGGAVHVVLSAVGEIGFAAGEVVLPPVSDETVDEFAALWADRMGVETQAPTRVGSVQACDFGSLPQGGGTESITARQVAHSLSDILPHLPTAVLQAWSRVAEGVSSNRGEDEIGILLREFGEALDTVGEDSIDPLSSARVGFRPTPLCDEHLARLKHVAALLGARRDMVDKMRPGLAVDAAPLPTFAA